MRRVTFFRRVFLMALYCAAAVRLVCLWSSAITGQLSVAIDAPAGLTRSQLAMAIIWHVVIGALEDVILGYIRLTLLIATPLIGGVWALIRPVAAAD